LLTPADLILHNANVLPLDTALAERAQALAVAGGLILAVGSEAQAARHKTAETQLVDCQGRTLLPGFIDAHCHLLAYAAALLSVDCSPSAVASIGDIQAALRARAEATPAGGWVRAVGYDESALAEGRHPTRWDLDAAVPHHPARLIHRTGHACVLNSAALGTAGIDIATEEPPGGHMERDPSSGEPTGLLLEMDDLVDAAVPPLPYAELAEGVRRASERFLSEGITYVQDATASNGIEEWRLLERLRREGHLRLPAAVMEGYRCLGELPEAVPDLGLRRGAAKIAVSELGGEIYPREPDLAEMVWEVHGRGRQVSIHAVEERAVTAAAGAIAEALDRRPRPDHRHRIEHCGICPPELAARLAELEVVVVTQPTFVYHNGDAYLARVPETDLAHLYPLAALRRAGVALAAGSDCPVAPPSVLTGLYGAVARRSRRGSPVVREQALRPVEALHMYTGGAAFAAFEEASRGSLSPGKRADLVLLSGDPAAVPEEEIRSLRVELVVVGGEIAWRASAPAS